MCGIIGYLGERSAAPIIMDSLKRLEYRGYDSAGVAIFKWPERIIHVPTLPRNALGKVLRGELKTLAQSE